LFSEYDAALRSIDQITAIHKSVEASRGAHIPDEAYLDVLYLLIDYSIRSYELLERKLTETEKAEVFEVFYRVGQRMELKDLPTNYIAWTIQREKQLGYNLRKGELTYDLYSQYKKHLGLIRFHLLKQAQLLVVPKRVKILLGLGNIRWLLPVLYVYKLFRLLKLQNLLKNAILPTAYVNQVKAMDTVPSSLSS
jgi:hypothetical protein